MAQRGRAQPRARKPREPKRRTPESDASAAASSRASKTVDAAVGNRTLAGLLGPQATAPATHHSRLALEGAITAGRIGVAQMAGNQALQRMLGSGSAAAGTVQRLTEEPRVVSGVTHLVEISGQSIMAGTEADTLEDGDRVVIDTDERWRSRRGIHAEEKRAEYEQGPHEFVWSRALMLNWEDKSDKQLFVRDEMLKPREASSPESVTNALAQEALKAGDPGAKLHDFEQSDRINELKKDLEGLPDGAEKSLKEDEKSKLSDQRTDEELAASAFSGGAQLLALVSSINKLMKAEGGWKRTEAGMDVAVQTVKTGAAAASIVDKAGKHKYGASAGFGGQAGAGAKEGTEASTMAAGVMSGAAEILAGVVALVKGTKRILDRRSKEVGKPKVGKHKRVDEDLSTLKEFTSAAKSAVAAFKAIDDVHGGAAASAGVTNAVPGLGIALSAIDLVQRAYKFVVNATSKGSARAEKKKSKVTLSQFTSSQDSLKWKKTKWRGTLYKKDVLEKYALYKQLGEKVDDGETVTDEERKFVEFVDANGGAELFEGYLFTKELQYINEKRMRRQAIGIGLDANNIIAEALTLGGVTTAAGLGMKIAGAATGFFVKATRRFKQWARDKAAAKKATAGLGTDEALGGVLGMFNADKSSEAKAKKREEMINRMLKLIVEWQREPDDGVKTAQEQRLKIFFDAAGLEWSSAKTYESAGALAEDLDSALKSRE